MLNHSAIPAPFSLNSINTYLCDILHLYLTDHNVSLTDSIAEGDKDSPRLFPIQNFLWFESSQRLQVQGEAVGTGVF